MWHTETPFFVQTGVKNIEILITKTLFKVDFRCSERASCNLHIIRCNVSVWLLRGHLVSITVLVFLLPRSCHVGKEKERWGWFPWLQFACFFFFLFLFFFSTAADHRGRRLPVLLITKCTLSCSCIVRRAVSCHRCVKLNLRFQRLEKWVSNLDDVTRKTNTDVVTVKLPYVALVMCTISHTSLSVHSL